MNRSELLKIAASVLLVALLALINAFPFFTTTATSYEIIYFALSAIHAELCLIVAWGVLVERRRRLRRMVWCLVGVLTVVLVALRLLPGQWSGTRPLQSVLFAMAATLPAILPMVAIFAAQRLFAGTEIDWDPKVRGAASRFRLQQLFTITAGCAFFSVLLRQVIKKPDGWFVISADEAFWAQAIVESFIAGLLMAPCALVCLKPNRFCVLWSFYFLAIMAGQPIFGQVAQLAFAGKLERLRESWIWPESYSAIILENITWYGPQLLPTALLFLAFRLCGVQVRDSK